MAKVRILIKLRAQILDPEGEAVAGAIRRSGLADPESARVAKVVELDLPGTPAELEEKVRKIADEVLVNPVMQDFEIEWL